MKLFLFMFAVLCLSQVCFSQDSLVSDQKIETSSFTYDKLSEFKGGRAGWAHFLRANLDASTPASHGAPDGTYTVVFGFIIDENGAASDYHAETRVGYGLEIECLRVLMKVKKWKPATKGGKPVKSYRHQPFSFVVGES